MSVHRTIQVICDECLEESDDVGLTNGEARMKAREDGWKFSKGRDICPDCQSPADCCPHDGNRLRWVWDQLLCPQCDDQWSNEEVTA
jgi:hypothetical protein